MTALSPARPRHAAMTALVLAAAAPAAAALHGALSPAHAVSAALVAVTVAAWAVGLWSEALTALGFFAAAVLLRVAPASAVFSGFGAPSFWLIFSGLIAGAALRDTGLGARLADRLGDRLEVHPAWTLPGAVLLGLALSFLLPSAMGRVVLLVPVLQSLARRLGHAPEGRAGRGILLAGVLGTALPSTAILPANIPNNVLAGLVQSDLHVRLGYGAYLAAHFPLLGAAKAVLLVLALLPFYQRAVMTPESAPLASRRAAPAAAERRLAQYLGLACLLWLTDSVHGVDPAWVGLLLALACLLPGVGVLPVAALRQLNVEPLLFVAGIVGVGAVIAVSGLGADLAMLLRAVLPLRPGAGLGNFLVLCGASTALALLTTLPGVPAVLTPLTGALASLSGLPTPMVLASQVVGFSTLLFPYQSPPLVAALQLGPARRLEMTAVCLVVAAASAALLWPLDYPWLRMLQGS